MIIFCGKMRSEKSTNSEMPFGGSDDEMWKEEEVSRNDDGDCGPGFAAPTAGAPASMWCKYFACIHLLVKS